MTQQKVVTEQELLDSKIRLSEVSTTSLAITEINDALVNNLLGLDPAARKDKYHDRFFRCQNYAAYRRNYPDGQTRGLLHLAVENQDTNLVEFLLENCPKEQVPAFLESTGIYYVPRFESIMKNCTPLQLATCLGNLEIMAELLDRGANPNCTADVIEADKNDQYNEMASATPVELTCKHVADSVPILQLLKIYDANFWLPPKIFTDESLICDAIRLKKPDTLDYLLNTIKVTAVGTMGKDQNRNPYIIATINAFSTHPKLPKLIKDLIRQGANINQPNEKGELPLHVAIRKLSSEEIRCIFELRPKALWSRNLHNETAFSLLAKKDIDLAEVFYQRRPPSICYIFDFDGTLTWLAGESAFKDYGASLQAQVVAFASGKITLSKGAKELLEQLIVQANVIINSNNYSAAIKAALKKSRLTDQQVAHITIFGREENQKLAAEQKTKTTENAKLLRLQTLINSAHYDKLIVADDDKRFITAVNNLEISKCTTLYAESARFDWDDTGKNNIWESSQPIIKTVKPMSGIPVSTLSIRNSEEIISETTRKGVNSVEIPESISISSSFSNMILPHYFGHQFVKIFKSNKRCLSWQRSNTHTQPSLSKKQLN